MSCIVRYNKPIWQHFTKDKPAKTKVSWKVTTRKHSMPKKMSNNPLTNVYNRLQKKRSSSRAIIVKKTRYRKTLIVTMYMKMGRQISNRS